MGQKAPLWQWEGDATGLEASITQDTAAPISAGVGIAKVASGAGIDSATSDIGSTNLLEDSSGAGNEILWEIDNSYGQSLHMFDADFAVFCIIPSGLDDGDWQPWSLVKDDQSKFPLDLVMRQGGTNRVDLNVGESEFVFSKDPLTFDYSAGEEDGLQILVTWSVAENTLSLYKNGVLADSATLVSTSTPFLTEALLAGFSTAAKAIADLIRVYDYIPVDPGRLITAIDDYHRDVLDTAPEVESEDTLNDWELNDPALGVLSTIFQKFNFGTILKNAAISGQILTTEQIAALNNWRNLDPGLDRVRRVTPFQLGDVLNEAMGLGPYATVLTADEIQKLNGWAQSDPDLARASTLTAPFMLGDYLNDLLTR